MFAWTLRMAWRDSRHSRRRLLLYLSSIIMGVAALVSVRSFGDSLLEAVDEQAKALLGADLSIRSRTAFDDNDESLLLEIGGNQSRQISFSSMAYFPAQNGTRLVQVRALEGEFPYYGELETTPAEAARTFRDGSFALVDNTLMLQFQAQVGDPVKVGSYTFQIAGRLSRIPGESAALSEIAPRIYIPLSLLEETGLIQVGSRVSYRSFIQFEPGFDTESFVEEIEPRLKELELSSDTVQERREDFQRELSNLNNFLSLVGFVALILGGIGVASSIHLYVRQRVETIAILRCIGASPLQSLGIYLVQAAIMGLTGALAGATMGLLVQRLIPVVLAGLIPLEVENSISWGAVAEGLLVGLGAALLFAAIPLLPVRRISPLFALRKDFENTGKRSWDSLVLAAYLALGAALLLFSLLHAPRWTVGLGFFGAILVVFGLLFAVAKLAMTLIKRYFPSSWRYEWRQGLANLYRPHNQTIVLMLAVGLGTFFIVTLYLTQQSLLREVELAGSEGRPNLVFFDIQTDQRQGIADLLEAKGLPTIQDVPIVTLRIKSVEGRAIEELKEEPEYRRARWALSREYRCTYRGQLDSTETVVAGNFEGTYAEGPVPVSIELEIAERLNLSIGDQLEFDVQGVPVEARVGSIRTVAWRSFQPNFFIVFPTGILEEAPQFGVLVTRTESASDSAEIQREVIAGYPNVSAIDLSMVVETVESILDRLTFVIRFMALFSIATGLVVLTGAIVSGKYQRMKESVLLRTLGASRTQIRRIFFIEYFFLGSLAASTGILLSLVGSWALTRFVFESQFVLEPMVTIGVLLGVVALTIGIGFANSRGILDQPPLAVLRTEE
ncbi:MAG TPA: FtsX-like permease family protein [Acidobacteriota bacterium]|nr:FtsX-like permease family protein [Acidobacteriota bacterium]